MFISIQKYRKTMRLSSWMIDINFPLRYQEHLWKVLLYIFELKCLLKHPDLKDNINSDESIICVTYGIAAKPPQIFINVRKKMVNFKYNLAKQ